MVKSPLKEIKDLQNEILRKKPLKGIDITKIQNFSQFQILKYLLECREVGKTVYQKDFENILNIRKSTLSGILDTMEKNKIISRVTSNGEAKGNIIELEDNIKECQEEMVNRILRLEESITRGIDREDLEIFYNVVDKMKENLRKDDNDV